MTVSETRNRIIEAAALEFAEKGFAGATTRAIAARAGVNEVTLFRHFGNKQELFAAVLMERQVTRPLVERAIEALRERPPREALHYMATQQLKGLEQNLPWLKLQWMGGAGEPYPARGEGLGYRQALSECIRHWQRQGLLRADLDPAMAAEAFATGVLGFVIAHRVIFPGGAVPPTADFVTSLVEIYASGMEVRP